MSQLLPKLFTYCVILLLISFRSFICYVEKDAEDFGKSKRKGRANPSVKALEAWADYLNPEVDYNTTLWKIAHRSSTWSVHFNEYAKKLSKVFESARAKVNFAMIGACAVSYTHLTLPTILRV